MRQKNAGARQTYDGHYELDHRTRRQVADVSADDAEQRDDRGLVGGDAVEITHRARLQAACSGTNRYSESAYFGGDGIAEE